MRLFGVEELDFPYAIRLQRYVHSTCIPNAGLFCMSIKISICIPIALAFLRLICVQGLDVSCISRSPILHTIIRSARLIKDL
eukprot:8347281-Pyramimonas_sp.AAC.1